MARFYKNGVVLSKIEDTNDQRFAVTTLNTNTFEMCTEFVTDEPITFGETITSKEWDNVLLRNIGKIHVIYKD